MKLVLLFAIVRIKYSMHYGTRVSYREIHFVLDRYSRYFNFRRYYQMIYSKISVLGGRQVERDGEMLFWIILICTVWSKIFLNDLRERVEINYLFPAIFSLNRSLVLLFLIQSLFCNILRSINPSFFPFQLYKS